MIFNINSIAAAAVIAAVIAAAITTDGGPNSIIVRGCPRRWSLLVSQ